MIRLTVPSIEEDDLQAVREVIASGYLVQGRHVEIFEQAVANYVGTNYAIAVSNCTAALHLALLAINVQQGDLVLVSAYSWIATANVIELCGAQPVFIDIERDTFNMDPDALQNTLSNLMSVPALAKRVKAILPVHTFGLMADLTKIINIASTYNLPVIEDAACALGADINGKKAGTWGVMGCFSFHPRKAITTGEGGIITTNDSAIARRLRSLRNHGIDTESKEVDFIEPGFNYRMTEFQAALGGTQMNKLERIIRARQTGAKRYNELLKNTAIKPPVSLKEQRHVYQSYIVLLPEQIANLRDKLINQLKNEGIETTIGTYHMPLSKYYSTRYGYKLGDLPIAEEVRRRSLALPLYETIKQEEQTKVINHLLTFNDKYV